MIPAEDEHVVSFQYMTMYLYICRRTRVCFTAQWQLQRGIPKTWSPRALLVMEPHRMQALETAAGVCSHRSRNNFWSLEDSLKVIEYSQKQGPHLKVHLFPKLPHHLPTSPSAKSLPRQRWLAPGCGTFHLKHIHWKTTSQFVTPKVIWESDQYHEPFCLGCVCLSWWIQRKKSIHLDSCMRTCVFRKLPCIRSPVLFSHVQMTRTLGRVKSLVTGEITCLEDSSTRALKSKDFIGIFVRMPSIRNPTSTRFGIYDR